MAVNLKTQYNGNNDDNLRRAQQAGAERGGLHSLARRVHHHRAARHQGQLPTLAGGHPRRARGSFRLVVRHV